MSVEGEASARGPATRGTQPLTGATRDGLFDSPRGPLLSNERELERSWLMQIKSIAKLGGWSLNPLSGGMTWSEELCRILEVETDFEPRTKSQFLEFLHPDDRRSFELTLARSVEDHKDGVAEIRLMLKSGVRKIADQRWRNEFDDEGNATRVLGTCQDVTASRKIESELRQQKAQLALAGRLAKIGAWRLDIGAPVVWWSDEVCVIHEVPLGTAPTLDEAIGFYLPHCRERIRMACQACIDQGEPFDLEFEIATGKGRLLWVRAIGEAVRTDNNATVAIQGAFQDITHSKGLETARGEAELASSAKTAFLATMSHEIRTPMNGVIGLIDVLSRTRLLADQIEIVDLLNVAAKSLLTIIDSILDVSKIEAGRMQLELLPFRLSEEVEKVCAVLQPSAALKDVGIYVFVDPAMPPLLMGDATRIRQVLLNLIGNAAKFSSGRGKSGEVWVRATCAKTSQQEVPVTIEISDNGIGMDAETVGRLFTAFDQADVSTTRRFGGTGLGLAISHSLISLMGGEIAVRSAPAVGSVFQVRLNLRRCEQVAGKDTERQSLHGISCEILGRFGCLASDLASYLTDAGATIETLAAKSGKPHVIVVLPGQALSSLIKARARFVALLVGKSVSPEIVDAGHVEMDVRAMSSANLIRAVALAAGYEMESSGPRRTALAASRSQRPGVILVAEDNEMNREVIARQLRLLSCSADFASDGRQALELWRLHDYVVLLSDLRMPEMDGYALAAAIRAGESPGKRLPIIALTANALPEEAEHCRAAGFDDYLTKPLLLETLRLALEKWLPADPGYASVDLSVLRSMIGDDEAEIARMLKTFRSGSRQLRMELKRAAVDDDRAAAASAAHRFKSNAYSIGAKRLGDLCAQIEQAETAPDIGALGDLVRSMDVEAATVDTYLKTLLHKRAKVSTS